MTFHFTLGILALISNNREVSYDCVGELRGQVTRKPGEGSCRKPSGDAWRLRVPLRVAPSSPRACIRFLEQ